MRGGGGAWDFALFCAGPAKGFFLHFHVRKAGGTNVGIDRLNAPTSDHVSR